MSRTLSHIVTGLVCCGMILPSGLMAAEPGTAQPSIVRDVALQAGGDLVGRFVDNEGRAIDGATITLSQAGQPVGQATTDPSGTYTFTHVRGGLYQITAGNSNETFRVWSAQTAPPVAQSYALVVNPGQVVRGQGYCGPNCPPPCTQPCPQTCCNCCCRPNTWDYITGGAAITAAVLAGIALSEIDDDGGVVVSP
jgi:hypothetical protein